MIDQCCELLQLSDVPEANAVALTLRADLRKPFLAQPPDHSGDTRTRMYQVTITPEQCQLLLGVVEQAARQKAFSQNTQSRGLGGFAQACEELIRWRAKYYRG